MAPPRRRGTHSTCHGSRLGHPSGYDVDLLRGLELNPRLRGVDHPFTTLARGRLTCHSPPSGSHLSKRSPGSRGGCASPAECAAPGANGSADLVRPGRQVRRVGPPSVLADFSASTISSAPTTPCDATEVAMSDNNIARLARDRRGTHAGHIDPPDSNLRRYMSSDLGLFCGAGRT
jgi:hypothetical protein